MATSQSLRVGSLLPVRTLRPSGENATELNPVRMPDLRNNLDYCFVLGGGVFACKNGKRDEQRDWQRR